MASTIDIEAESNSAELQFFDPGFVLMLGSDVSILGDWIFRSRQISDLVHHTLLPPAGSQTLLPRRRRARSSYAHGDLETGHVYCVAAEMGEFEELPDDIGTSDLYLMLQDKRDLALGRNLAISFAEEALPDQYETVVDCFRKKGAYGRFKELLERNHALAKWHEFEAKQMEIALREWCR